MTIPIGIDPVLLRLGPLAVRWYGLMYVIGITVALWVVLPYVRKRGIDEGQVWSLFWYAAVAGLVGARLYYVVQSDLGYYLTNPEHILATWEGGMAFYGAIFAVVPVIAIFCRLRGVNTWALLDGVALFALLGQSIGRIGNIINGDIVGYPTDLPWGTVYTNPNALAPQLGVAYQPAAAYELIFGVAAFLALWRLRFYFKHDGLLFATYLIVYSVGQFVIFFLRDNAVVALGLKQAQLTAIVVLMVAFALVYWLRLRPATTPSGTLPPSAPRGACS